MTIVKPQCLHLKKHTANTKLGTGTCKKSQRKRKKATGQLFFLRLLRGTLLFLLMLNDLRSKGNNLKSSLSVSAVPAKELSEGWVGGGWETHAQNGEALFAAKERRKKSFLRRAHPPQNKTCPPHPNVTEFPSSTLVAAADPHKTDGSAARRHTTTRRRARRRRGSREHEPPQLLVPLQIDARRTSQRRGQVGRTTAVCVSPS